MAWGVDMSYQRVIIYDDASQTLRLEFPSHWNASAISGITLDVKDVGGGELLTAEDATLYAATTLGAAATLGATTITLDSGAGALANGDRIRLSSPPEDCEVQAYNSTTHVATLKRALLYAHADDSDVYPLWCTYDLDTSDTDTWVLGDELVTVWTPDSDDLPLTEYTIIRGVGLGAQAYRERFAALYPSEYEVAQLRLDSVHSEARERLRYRLAAKGMDIDKVVDQSIVMPVLLDMMRWLIVLAGGNAYADEREAAWAAFLGSEEMLMSQPIWVDDSQDQARDESEVTVHEPWVRARGL